MISKLLIGTVLMTCAFFISSCMNSSNSYLDTSTECPTYFRDDFNYGIDEDGDCQYTRAELLIQLSLRPVTFTKSNHCSVDSGEWVDPYSGKTFFAASQLQVDHIVPLSEAFQSGAWGWSTPQKRTFANDFENLIPVESSLNQAKGDKDPKDWMPPNASYELDYVRRFAKVKDKYSLTYDSLEIQFLEQVDASLNLQRMKPEFSCDS